MEFEDLYERHSRLVRHYLRLHVAPDDVEDLTQVVWLRAWRGWERFTDTGDGGRSWLMRTAHNTLVNHYRDSARHPIERLTERVPGPDCIDAVEVRLHLRRVVSAFGGLTERERRALQRGAFEVSCGQAERAARCRGRRKLREWGLGVHPL